MYKLLTGGAPFTGSSRNELVTNINKSREVVFPSKEQYDIQYSEELVDVIRELLMPQAFDRLGNSDGAEEVLSHPFFGTLDNMNPVKPRPVEHSP